MTTSTTEYTSFTETDPNVDSAEMRAIMDEQGYLFFRGLVPVDEVLAVRRIALELCREAGWLDPNYDLMEAVVAPGVGEIKEGHPEYMPMYRKLLKTPRFHELPAQPALMDVARKLLGEEVLVHPRRIGRVTFPNYLSATTPPHQDHYYIRGAVETYSSWVPLGDCPISLGGLAVWPGSHRQGFLDHTAIHPGAVGGHGVPVDESQINWHTIDWQAGDAIFFHSYMIHRALPNLSGNRLRVSTDNRYQRPKEDIHPGSLLPHLGLDLSDNNRN